MSGLNLKPSLARQLSTLVVEALVRCNLTQEDVLKGEIRHTNLPWQIPALQPEVTLFGVPLGDYLGAVTSVNAENLFMLWSEALHLLRNAPDKVLTPDGYRRMLSALPDVRVRERPLHLSIPEGYPEMGVGEFTGAMLSLECAHLVRHNLRIESFVSDENNYYAVVPVLGEIGIKNGVPAHYGEIWDLSIDGMVQEMLNTPRGAVWEGCDYDIIAKVRSVVRELEDRIREFDGVDWCLQTLRVIGGAPELLAAIRSLTKVSHIRKMRRSIVEDAVELAHQITITDRQRIDALRNLLVPEVVSAAHFSRHIYPQFRVPPAMLSEKVLKRIQAYVMQLHDKEMDLYAPNQN